MVDKKTTYVNVWLWNAQKKHDHTFSIPYSTIDIFQVCRVCGKFSFLMTRHMRKFSFFVLKVLLFFWLTQVLIQNAITVWSRPVLLRPIPVEQHAVMHFHKNQCATLNFSSGSLDSNCWWFVMTENYYTFKSLCLPALWQCLLFLLCIWNNTHALQRKYPHEQKLSLFPQDWNFWVRLYKHKQLNVSVLPKILCMYCT